MSGCTKVTVNPFTGKLEVYKNEVEFSNNIVESRSCLATADVGDLVVESETFVDRVDVAEDNLDIRPVFAIIIEKTSETTCTILLLGQVGGFSGLVKSRKVFLDVDGSITSTPPTTGYMQSLGVAKEDSVVDFRPNMQRVRRTP